MKTKTKIGKQLKRKTNPVLVETILLAKKNKNWKQIAEILSGSRKNHAAINLEKINLNSKDGEKIAIPGKVLSQGDIDKKIKITAISFSEKAKDKLLKAKCEINYMNEEIKKNPDAKGIIILK
jgi:large subunit ribosomal protein L18e